MTKLTVKTAGLLFSGVCMFGGCAEDRNLPETNERIIITVGVDNHFPPMAYTNENNEFVGYEIDLINEVGVRLGCEMTLYPIEEWHRKEELLYGGAIDCIWNSLTITDERAKRILFSPPYLENFQILLVMDSSPYKTVDDLRGKTLGTQRTSTGEQALKANPKLLMLFSEHKHYVKHCELISALENGDVDAVVMDSVFAADRIMYNKKDFRILRTAVAAEQYGIGFRLGDTELRDTIWQALQAMQADGTVGQISRKWFGQDRSVIK